MRQLAYLGVAALSAVALIGVGCSSDDDNKTTGSGGATSAVGGGAATGGKASTTGGKTGSSTTSVGTGGATSAATSVGGVTSTGGATGTTGGSTGAATGGAPTVGGTTGTAVTSTGGSSMIQGDNIVNETCEVKSTPGAMGVVGGFYVYGDQNAEHPNGQSCTIPPQGTNACEPLDGGICLSGATIKDTTYAAWGCGIGLSLNATGSSDADAGDTGDAGATGKSTYSGPATCFELTFTGSTGGLTLRVGFTQYADPSLPGQGVAPFKTLKAFTNGWTGQVCFADVTCPNWSTAASQGCPANLVATPSSSYDLQIQVPGGDGANTYDFCLTKVIPLKPPTP